MSVTELGDSVSGSFSLSLKVNFKTRKRKGTTQGMLQTPLWDMKCRAELADKQMNLHSGLKYLTLHSLHGKAAEQQESCYLCIHHPLQKE